MFLGPTGVGKTELTKALAGFLFDDETALVRIDMSEYMEKHAVARLIGAPPGYVGYEEGGALTEAVRRRPYQVVLFDEIEKAHPDVFNVLLQVLDDGRLTDGQGRTVDFRNVLVIMTSNLGSEYLVAQKEGEDSSAVQPQVMQTVRAHFRPEFLNRVDEIILFHRLRREDMGAIVDIQFGRLGKLLEDRKIDVELEPKARAWLADKGYDPSYGARPLKRVIQKHVQDPLAEMILAGEIGDGETVRIGAERGSLTINGAPIGGAARRHGKRRQRDDRHFPEGLDKLTQRGGAESAALSVSGVYEFDHFAHDRRDVEALRRINAGNAALLERLLVGGRYDSADQHGNVRGALPACMSARTSRASCTCEPDRTDSPMQWTFCSTASLHKLLGGHAYAVIGDVEPDVARPHRDLFSAVRMAVKTGLPHEQGRSAAEFFGERLNALAQIVEIAANLPCGLRQTRGRTILAENFAHDAGPLARRHAGFRRRDRSRHDVFAASSRRAQVRQRVLRLGRASVGFPRRDAPRSASASVPGSA